MMVAAPKWPAATHFSKGASRTKPARKPPTKPLPAPLVSTISFSSNLSTGKVLTSSPLTATTVGSEPLVMTTVR